MYGYDAETRQQTSQWKTPNSPRARKVRLAKCKVKRMLIIFFEIKEFVLAGQTVYSTYYFDDGARGSVVVKTICYKPEGRGFETR
jgi:hypothetical protein